jgi:subfamily B ATP-binding cassette protein MsbA
MYTRLQEGLGASKRLFELLDTHSEVLNLPNAQIMPPISGRVEFDKTCFHYRKDREILKNISFKIDPGQTIALVGPSGAGKTTLIRLLHRFYDPTQGEIRVDGILLKNVEISSYWKQIGIVPQETILFGGTIEMNIKYAKENATENEIIAAAKAANAHKFITECPEGYQTIVGEKGIRLSAGQRQRIAIARVILKNPRILILDEATSALDNESEILIQEALERLMKNRTSIVIAHRLSTIHKAEKILVMNDGAIIESGTHSELIKQKGLYHRLYTLKNLELEPRGKKKTETII